MRPMAHASAAAHQQWLRTPIPVQGAFSFDGLIGKPMLKRRALSTKPLASGSQVQRVAWFKPFVITQSETLVWRRRARDR
jgi:hypothetical protein